MDTITIADLEAFCHVGVTEAERAQPQRLLITLQLTHDFAAAQTSDNLADTIDYVQLVQRVLQFGHSRQWALIETLAADLATMILEEFGPRSVAVEVKKFVIPQARYVSVRLARRKDAQGRPVPVD
jgi:dihydroneopterin aldolase